MYDYWFKRHALCALILCIGSVITVNGCNDVSNAPPPPTGPTGLTVTTTALPPATINQPYAATVSATGGVTPYSWSVSPALPANVALDAGTGAINGIPAAQGASNHTFTVQDSSNPPKTSQRLLTFNVPGAPSITTTSLPPGTVNSPYPPTTLTAAGGLPRWCGNRWPCRSDSRLTRARKPF